MNEAKITVEELEEKQLEVFRAKATYEASKAKTSDLYAEFKKLQGAHVERLEALGKTSYKSDAGNFSYTMVENVKLDPAKKREFWEYLKSRGLFEDMITVNSQTLNSFAKGEMAAMEEAGDLDPELPGLIKTEPYAKASMRKN